MIRALTVENIAIIDRADLTLSQGFTALTGETGAGKSLLIDAITLALGGRAESELVREGAAKGTVTLVVDIRENSPAQAKCEELGIEVEDHELVIHREVSVEGRSVVRVNGKPVNVGTLRAIGAHLIDLHGQHDHQSLLNPDRQIEFFDAWIGEEAFRLRAHVAAQYSLVQDLHRQLSSVRRGQRERAQRIDMLQFQIEEIAGVEPQPGETHDLENLLSRLQNAERLGQGVQVSLGWLADDEGSVSEHLGLVARELSGLRALDEGLSDATEPIIAAHIALEEAIRGLRLYSGQLEPDPEALETTAARLDSLSRLKRKYGDTEEAILEYLARAEAELTALTDQGLDEATLVDKIEQESACLQQRASELTKLRRTSALIFQAEVEGHIRDLAMDKAVFRLSLSPVEITEAGADLVTFDFSANPGEPARALSKVASGGELSRVMLAIKVASAGRAGVPSLVFDEVDTGLSGRAAAAVARKLEQLAEHTQVLVISHLPQIAGRAQTHFLIEKSEVKGRVRTGIHELLGPERVEEIARMLAGDEVGESALANATELLGDRVAGRQVTPMLRVAR